MFNSSSRSMFNIIKEWEGTAKDSVFSQSGSCAPLDKERAPCTFPIPCERS